MNWWKDIWNIKQGNREDYFCKLIQNISSKCYEIAREVFILPTIDSLDKKFSDEEKHLRKLLKHVESIPQLIELYKEIYQVP